MGAMTTTDTRTASQIITDEVTSWPGVEAGIGRRGEFGFTVGKRAARPPPRRLRRPLRLPQGRLAGALRRRPDRLPPGLPRQEGLGRAPDRGRRRRPRRHRDAAPELRPRGQPLVQRGGELAARLARERVLGAELVEHADDHAAQVVAALLVVGGGDRLDQQRRARAPARRRRAPRTPRPAQGRPPAGCARRGPRRRRSRSRWRAARRLVALAALVQQAARARARRRRGWARARARGAATSSSPSGDERVGLGGHQPVEELARPARAAGRRRTRRRACRP